MNVQQLMRPDVKTCGQRDTLNRAAQLMWENDCGCVPVVEEGSRLVGILTDRDICMAAYTQGKPLHELPVEWAMSRKVWSVRPEEPVSAAKKLLAEKKVRRLPVVDGSGRLLGILSLNDIAREAARERRQRSREVSDAEVGETLATISEPRAASELLAPPARGAKELTAA